MRLLEWQLEPGAVVGVLLLAVGYALGTRAVWRAAQPGRGITRGSATCFGGGWLALVAALVSPLDAMSENLVSAHMVQHILIIVVAPPLLVLGRPLVALSWALPGVARRSRLWASRVPRPFRSAPAALMAPLPVWLLHTVAVWVWHFPGPYQAALRRPAMHALEHLCFLGSALLFWWVVLALGAERRTRMGLGLLLVFATAVQSGALGALLTLAPRPWYPAQALGAVAWGLTPLEDQQLAGLIMWVPGGLLYVAAAAVLFVRWLEPGAVPGARRTARALAGVTSVALALVVGGCRADPSVAVAGASADRGREALAAIGCAACHTIPGVRGAEGKVGPPLAGIGSRTMIAGEAPNTPDNLIRWIRNPQSIEPGTAMPNLGVSEPTARDIAAYLYTLR